MTKQKRYNDLTVNNGFPKGKSLADLKEGALVKVRWSDHKDHLARVTSVQESPVESHWQVNIYYVDEIGPVKDFCLHTQVIEILE